MSNSKITHIRVVSVNNLRVFCKCGASLMVSGSPKGVRAAVKLWASDHKGGGHEPMTQTQWRKHRAAESKRTRLVKAKNLRDVKRNERIEFEKSKMTPLFQ